MKTDFLLSIENDIKSYLSDKNKELADILFNDNEIKELQEYANIVSIKRLGYNDHGRVHMRIAARNALQMAKLLQEAQIPLNLEAESIGKFDDSQTAILLAAFLHDIGMTVARNGHEILSVTLASPIINRVLDQIFDDIEQKVIIRSLAIEGIYGHMATQTIHTLEAGIILIADGCDMEKGRARIPMILNTESKVGDIHKYSASSIYKVQIKKGEHRPIRIEVSMDASVGFFQVEEVLYQKIKASPIKQFIELYAGVKGKELKCYL